MEFQGIRPDLVRYEMRRVGGIDPHTQERKRPGAFGRFLSGMGRFLGAVGMPLSVIFPPAAIGALGMYGISQVGDHVQQKAYQKMMEQSMKQRTERIYFPGLDLGNMPKAVPVSGPSSSDYILSSLDERLVDVIVAKSFLLHESAQLV